MHTKYMILKYKRVFLAYIVHTNQIYQVKIKYKYSLKTHDQLQKVLNTVADDNIKNHCFKLIKFVEDVALNSRPDKIKENYSCVDSCIS